MSLSVLSIKKYSYKDTIYILYIPIMGAINSKPAIDFDFYMFICKNEKVKHNYVGCTDNWNRRMISHKTRCNNPKDKNHNYKIYKTIRENGGLSNWIAVNIDSKKNISKTQAKQHEQFLMNQNSCTMNSRREIITDEERIEKHKNCNKKWYQKNKEEIKEKSKNYYKKNNEQILEYNINYKKANETTLKKKFNCEICGGKYTRYDKSKHFRTMKHKKALENN
jgi:hypothetical protein